MLTTLWNDTNHEVKLAHAQQLAAATQTPVTVVTANNGPYVPAKIKYDRMPKELPEGVWSFYVTAYESKQFDNKDREFPTNLILGADAVILRSWYQHEYSKMYVPIYLGEVLQHRLFTAYGQLNKANKHNHKADSEFALALDATGQALTAQAKQAFEPNTQMLIIDGATAAGWVWILFQYGNEGSIHKFIEWYVHKVRAHPNNLPAMKLLWDKGVWQIMLQMRKSVTFEVASGQVMANTNLLQECISESPEVKSTAKAASKGQDDSHGQQSAKGGRGRKPGRGRDHNRDSEGKGKRKGGQGDGRGRSRSQRDDWDSHDTWSSWDNSGGWHHKDGNSSRGRNRGWGQNQGQKGKGRGRGGWKWGNGH